MAPRGRSRKVGLGRIDAALDAMRPLGFSIDQVRKSVKDLLKVYGDDGWPFIEEASYKLLVETMLEEQENLLLEEQEQPLPIEQEQPYHHEQEQPYHHEQEQPQHEEQQHLEDGREAEMFDAVQCEKKNNCQENYPTLEDDVPSTKFEGNVNFAFNGASPILKCLPTTRTRKPCYGWISDDEEGD